MKRIIFYIVTFQILQIISGCIDDPVQSVNYSIKGNVHLGDGAFVGNSMGQIVQCDEWGNFEIETVFKPFDLIITDKYYWLYHSSTVKFNGITINSPQLVLPDVMGFGISIFDPSYEPCRITVNYPVLSEQKYIITKFISEDIYFQYDEGHYMDPGNYNNIANIYIRPEKNFINGKIYYLETKLDSVGMQIMTYDKFGMKNVTLIKGENPDITFDGSDLVDPAEYNMNYEINNLPGLNNQQSIIWLTNSSMNPGSDVLLQNIGNASSGNTVIPILPANEFKIKIYNEYVYSRFNFIDGMRSYYGTIGTPFILNPVETISLISPPDGYANVTKSTIFEFQDNDGPAIYEINVYYQQKFLKIYTSKKQIQFAEFENWNFKLPKNTSYSWTVRKFRKYNNIDEFVEKIYYQNLKSDYVEVNPGRTFKTVP